MGYSAAVVSEAREEQVLVLRREEGRVFRERDDEEIRGEADEDGDNPFDNEYPISWISRGGPISCGQMCVPNSPSPSSIARNPIHLGNQRGQETVERACTDTAAEEDDVAPQELISPVI